MALNPLYAPAEPAKRTEKHEPVKLRVPGDKVIGVVTEVGEPWDAPNNFYRPEGEHKDKPWMATVKTQKINLQTETGPRSLYLNKKSMFSAFGPTLTENGLSEVNESVIGWTLAFKVDRVEPTPTGQLAKVFAAKLVPPQG